MAIQRGCGSREAGACYLEVHMGNGGHPYSEFFKDPPVPIDPTEMGISPIGVKIRREDGEESGTVFDWVGSESYPNVADILEEMATVDKRARTLAGLSRRISPREPIELLGPNPTVALLHSRAILPDGELAIIRAAEAFPRFMRAAAGDAELHRLREVMHGACGLEARREHCEPSLSGHEVGPIEEGAKLQCTTTWWADLDAKGCVMLDDQIGAVRRTLGDTTYYGMARMGQRPSGYKLGIFAVFPISRIVVVADPMGGRDEQALRTLGDRSPIPVDLVDE